jgi:photosystem II stability/assembly factor-like uncharacterized protein
MVTPIKSLIGVSLCTFALSVSLLSSPAIAASDKEVKKDKSLLQSKTLSNLKFRNIGSAFKSGRISDIEIDPDNKNIWYVGVSSGGVWKTVNAGTTWLPLFDKEAVFAVGTVALDPQNAKTVWVGTGENNGGRHISFGDGVYRSRDSGKTWKNMGLKKSEHISEIIVHPTNSNIIWVAAQGPLWSKGGERGVFKTTDGGKKWQQVLGDKEWTGVTDLIIDPNDANILYAATWQRHRTVAAYMGSGPKSGIHKSIDGGETWQQLKTGLPKATTKMAKIGLAMSPFDSSVLYAAIELERRKGAVYRSSDKGESWVKGAEVAGGGTGPHYYTELYASPHNFDEIYLADVRMQVSKDGGKTFKRIKEEHKHSDNHSLTFRDDDKNYLLVGSDGGIYESFDKGENWRFISNLPITQYYKIAVDDDAPFYNVYGGTQDNNSQSGPSRTDSAHGIQNSDWTVTLFGDGHQPATEPGNPNVFYSEWQQGNLARMDKSTGGIVYIQPQPEAGEAPERFNWDAPILVSPHKPTRLYFASQRLWRSEDRGDSWTAISGDLTKNLARIEQPIMGKKQSWDNGWDIYAMSKYSTITSISESPQQAGLLYVGTDDGLIQVTENGGESWKKMKVGKLPGVPKTAFVNDIKADLHDKDTVYIALDNHKYGDFKPYLLKSTNKGKSWKSISANLPDKHLVWRVVQDHIKPELMFLGTEFGIFVTVNGGKKWIELNGGIPNISFRDLAIQKRENDLVAASFGRGIFILDDYSSLRTITEKSFEQDAILFKPRKAWWYFQKYSLGFDEKGSAGAQHYAAKNPDFGATFTYYLKDDIQSLKDIRQKKEKSLIKKDKNKDIKFPGWNAVEAERRQEKATMLLVVKDSKDNVIRRVPSAAKKGINRVTWDLKYPDIKAIHGNKVSSDNDDFEGVMAAPGNYTVTLYKQQDGKVEKLSEPVAFEVVRMKESKMQEASPEEGVAFRREIANVQREQSAVATVLKATEKRIKNLKLALERSAAEPGNLDKAWYVLSSKVKDLSQQLNGNKSKAEVGALDDHVSIDSRIFVADFGTLLSSYGPTVTHKRSLAIAKAELSQFKVDLKQLVESDIPAFEMLLDKVNAPWVVGQSLD